MFYRWLTMILQSLFSCYVDCNVELGSRPVQPRPTRTCPASNISQAHSEWFTGRADLPYFVLRCGAGLNLNKFYVCFSVIIMVNPFNPQPTPSHLVKWVVRFNEFWPVEQWVVSTRPFSHLYFHESLPSFLKCNRIENQWLEILSSFCWK